MVDIDEVNTLWSRITSVLLTLVFMTGSFSHIEVKLGQVGLSLFSWLGQVGLSLFSCEATE